MQQQHNQKILLSICIPTYDHSAYLKEAIDTVFKQVDEVNRECLELVINDNGSTDETATVILSLKAKAPIPIIAGRNSKNLGYDLNCLKVVELARGQDCWLLGDDDQILPGAINHVLAQIKGNPQVDVFMGNKEDFDVSFSKPMKFRPLFNISGDRLFDFNHVKVDEYFKISKKLICFFNFISILIFKRASWQSVQGREILKNIPDKIVGRRWGSDRVTAIVERLKEDVGFYDSLARNIFKNNQRYIRRLNSLVLKNDGFSWAVRARNVAGFGFYADVFPFLLKRFWSYPLFWFKIVPLLFLPVTLLKVIRWMYRRVVKGENVNWSDILQN